MTRQWDRSGIGHIEHRLCGRLSRRRRGVDRRRSTESRRSERIGAANRGTLQRLDWERELAPLGELAQAASMFLLRDESVGERVREAPEVAAGVGNVH